MSSQNKNIFIDETVDLINNLSNEKNKETFSNNVSKAKENIKIIDSVLDKKSELIEELPIDKLFEMLQEYNEYIESDLSIDVENFKKIRDIVELIEKKLDNKINVVEYK
jgi:hypothetical protein